MSKAKQVILCRRSKESVQPVMCGLSYIISLEGYLYNIVIIFKNKYLPRKIIFLEILYLEKNLSIRENFSEPCNKCE